MTEEQGFKLDDLRPMIRRRLPVMATVAGAVFLLSIVVAALLPNVLQASTTLLVEPQSISKKLIESGVAESDLNNRLHLMTHADPVAAAALEGDRRPQALSGAGRTR